LQLPGLEPFNVRTIFLQGTSWAKITEEGALAIIGAIPELAAEVLMSRKAACSDAKIREILGHVTGIMDMDEIV
jgi:hypothetical protein